MMKLGFSVLRDLSLLETVLFGVDLTNSLTTYLNVKVTFILTLFSQNVQRCKFFLDINECLSSQCDILSTECVNVPGSFSCKCRKGFNPVLDCRSVTDLGLISGAIPDESITTSPSEIGYQPTVSFKKNQRVLM